MPKELAADVDDRILEEIDHHPEGIGIEALHARFEEAISRRTLQRRLAQFVSEGKVVTKGKRRGLRYQLALNIGEIDGERPGLTDTIAADYIPLSPWFTCHIYNHSRMSTNGFPGLPPIFR